MDRDKDGAMNITTRNGLPFVAVELTHKERTLLPGDFLIDTGSAGTMVDVEYALELGLDPGSQDEITRIRGVGGAEFVYLKIIDWIVAGPLVATKLVVEVGVTPSSFGFGGILGMDFLSATNAIIDLRNMELRIYIHKIPKKAMVDIYAGKRDQCRRYFDLVLLHLQA